MKLASILALPACASILIGIALCEPPGRASKPLADKPAPANALSGTNHIEIATVKLVGGETIMAVREAGTTNIWMEASRLSGTNAPTPSPAFADGVVIAASVLRSNPGFATLLTSQEQVALCARVWQQHAQSGGAK